MAYSYTESNVVNLGQLKKAVARSQNEVTNLAEVVLGVIEDMVFQASITIPKTSWATHSDATMNTQGFMYKADITVSGILENAQVVVNLSAESLALAYSAGVNSIVVVSDDSIAFYSKTVPSANLTGVVNAVQLAED